jgi:hypothetical protein
VDKYFAIGAQDMKVFYWQNLLRNFCSQFVSSSTLAVNADGAHIPGYELPLPQTNRSL